MKTNQSAKATNFLQYCKTNLLLLIAVLGFSMAGFCQNKAEIGGQNAPRPRGLASVNLKEKTSDNFSSSVLNRTLSQANDASLASFVSYEIVPLGEMLASTKVVTTNIPLSGIAILKQVDARSLSVLSKTDVTFLELVTFPSIGGTQGPPRTPII